MIRSVLLAVCSMALVTTATRAAAAETPNVVLFYCDDMGYADMSPYGGSVPTPNVERLAKEGVKFTNFHVSQAVCSASRIALLTGCYNLRVGIGGALGPKSKIGINADETTMAEVFKSKGYTTALFGKWHLGDAPQFLPTRHGFDEWFGVPYSHDMWPKHPANPDRYPDLPLMEGDKVVKLNPDPGELTGAVTQHAVSFIDRNHDKPFFVYIPHPLPHVPLGVSKAFEGKSGKGLHGDVMLEIDDSVGQVLAAIKKHGLDEKTLVMFSSDNGPWLLYGNHGGSAGPLREGKATSFDGGTRVPFLARWPGHIPAGGVVKELGATIDILPTMASLIGAQQPEKKIDGLNIWPLITQQSGAKSPHEVYFTYWGKDLQAVHSGQWKLHFPHNYTKPNPPGGDGLPGKYSVEKIGLELFDMDADIGEQTNVADQHPDVVKKLQAYAHEMRKDLGDGNKPGNGAREPGTIDGGPPAKKTGKKKA